MKRTWLLPGAILGLGVPAAVAVALYAFGSGNDPDLLTEAPPIPTAVATATRPAEATSAPATTGPSVTATPVLPAPTVPPPTAVAPTVRSFTIDSGQSSGKLIVQQSVLGSTSSVVATTNNITGKLYLGAQGIAASPASTFRLDLLTLNTTNELLRRFLGSGELDTVTYPYAEFASASSSPFPANYTDGTEFSFTLQGTLSMNGRSQPVTWQVKARQSGQFFTATADSDISMISFDVSVPRTPLGSASDTVHIQVAFVARQD